MDQNFNELFNMNWDEINESDGFDLLEEGFYPAKIKSMEIKTSKSGTGKYINATFVITDCASAGRHLFECCMLTHSTSADAVKFGKIKYKKICKALGYSDAPPENPSELVGQQLILEVVQKPKSKDSDELDNVIKKFLEFDESLLDEDI